MKKTMTVCCLLVIGMMQISAESLITKDLAKGSVVVYAKDASQGFVFTPRQGTNGYIRDFVRWAQEDIGHIPQKDATLFVGSSSMRMWRNIKKDLAPLKLIHRGFGGSTMGHVMAFKDFFARYQASKIVVYEGDNDLMSKNPKCVDIFIKNCRDFVAYIHKSQPDTPIYFISPKPSISRWNKNKIFEAARAGLKAFAKENSKVHYIDVTTPMLGEDGTPKKDIFLKDKLHMNAKGYQIWTNVVREALGIGK